MPISTWVIYLFIMVSFSNLLACRCEFSLHLIKLKLQSPLFAGALPKTLRNVFIWTYAFFIKCGGASFHMSLGPLYVFLGEVSVQVLCPFFNWVVCLPGVELCELFIYFGDQTLVWGIIGKYVFPHGWFSYLFYFKINVLILHKFNNIAFKVPRTHFTIWYLTWDKELCYFFPNR